MDRIEDRFRPFAVSADRLRGLVEREAEASRTVATGQRSLAPALTVLSRGMGPDAPERTSVFVSAVPFDEHDQKHALLEGLGRQIYLAREIPMAAVLAAEAWSSERPEGAPDIEPRHDPGRREVIAVFGLALVGAIGRGAMMAVTRDGQGRMTPGELEWLEGASSPLLRAFFRGFAGGLPARLRAGLPILGEG
jgi:hypothetical protein